MAEFFIDTGRKNETSNNLKRIQQDKGKALG
jgi:hypothetical protein